MLVLSQDAETLVRRAELKLKDRDIEGAAADFSQAIQRDSRCAPAWYGRAQIRANKGQIGSVSIFSPMKYRPTSATKSHRGNASPGCAGVVKSP